MVRLEKGREESKKSERMAERRVINSVQDVRQVHVIYEGYIRWTGGTLHEVTREALRPRVRYAGWSLREAFSWDAHLLFSRADRSGVWKKGARERGRRTLEA